MYLTQTALDQLAAGLGIERVPYFTHNIFADATHRGFMAMHCAIEEGRDVFRERELLVGSFGRLFPAPRQRRRPHPAAPVDRQLLRRVKDRMHGDYAPSCDWRIWRQGG